MIYNLIFPREIRRACSSNPFGGRTDYGETGGEFRINHNIILLAPSEFGTEHRTQHSNPSVKYLHGAYRPTPASAPKIPPELFFFNAQSLFEPIDKHNTHDPTRSCFFDSKQSRRALPVKSWFCFFVFFTTLFFSRVTFEFWLWLTDSSSVHGQVNALHIDFILTFPSFAPFISTIFQKSRRLVFTSFIFKI